MTPGAWGIRYTNQKLGYSAEWIQRMSLQLPMAVSFLPGSGTFEVKCSREQPNCRREFITLAT